MALRKLQLARPILSAQEELVVPREVCETQKVNRVGYPCLRYSCYKVQANPGLVRPLGLLPLIFDDEPVNLFDVTRGGIATNLSWRSGRLASAAIRLDAPLKPGGMAEIAFGTWRRVGDGNPPTSYKYAVGRAALDSLALTINFSARRTPSRLWRAEWDGTRPDSDITLLGEVEIPSEPQPHALKSGLEVRHVDAGRVIGFHWEWPDTNPFYPDGGEPVVLPTDFDTAA